MSDIIVKGQPDPIDDRINAVVGGSFGDNREPEKAEAEPEPEQEKPEVEEQEVDQEPEEQEVDEPEDDDSEEDDEEQTSNKKPSRAEKRIRQLNEQKKEAQEKAQALELQIAEMRPYLDMLKAQLQQPQASDKAKEDAPLLPQDY